MEYGHFENGGREFVVTCRKTPRHWHNYMYNDEYVAFFSQVGFGEGFAQDGLGRRIPLVKDRMLYVVNRDTGAWSSANGLPMRDAFDAYECRHGAGLYRAHRREGRRAHGAHVLRARGGTGANSGACMRRATRAAKPARLSLIPFVDTDADDSYRPQAYNTDYGNFDAAHGAVWGHFFQAYESDDPAPMYAYMLSDAEPASFCARRNAFIGVYGNKLCPEALEEKRGLRGEEVLGEKLCLALDIHADLQPGEEKAFTVVIGAERTLSDLTAVRAMAAGSEGLLSAIREKRAEEISGLSITTPDARLNDAFNGFYQYATCMGSRWARVRHNGYRDMTSDTECLSSFNAELARARFRRILSYQYENGYAPRTFIGGRICDNNFSDCAVWIPFALDAILRETGDLSFLNEVVPFNSGAMGTVYEHARRSVEFLSGFTGPDGLVRIWGGDWNDCMNRAGLGGKGESVWLSIAWIRACKMLIRIARLSGHDADADALEPVLKQMNRAVDARGWDGEWYLTAIDDEGRDIGSRENEEGKIFLIPQLWAVLADLDDKARVKTAMESANRLLEAPLGTRVSWPGVHAYRQPHRLRHPEERGRARERRYLPAHDGVAAGRGRDAGRRGARGARHPADRSVGSDLRAHRGRAVHAVQLLLRRPDRLPLRHARPELAHRVHAVVREGLTLYVFGLQPDIDGLHIHPCLPASWNACAATKKLRGCEYRVTYTRTGAFSVTADGERIPGRRRASAEARPRGERGSDGVRARIHGSARTPARQPGSCAGANTAVTYTRRAAGKKLRGAREPCAARRERGSDGVRARIHRNARADFARA